MMALVGLKRFLVMAACLGMAGCATPPTASRARVVDMPLASAHADISFSLATGSRQNAVCDGKLNCPGQSDRAEATRFNRQVQRIAGALQQGADQLYPDLAQRVPGLAASRFDVYVVEGAEPGSASSANGRIALNAALGTGQPYDDWLAFVIAREMGHVIARHHEENSAASIATAVVMNIVIPGSGLLKSLVSAGGSGLASSGKRDVQDLEADAIASRLLEAAGFRLRDVSLSLRLAPALPNEGQWSNNFRRSSHNILSQVRKS